MEYQMLFGCHMCGNEHFFFSCESTKSKEMAGHRKPTFRRRTSTTHRRSSPTRHRSSPTRSSSSPTRRRSTESRRRPRAWLGFHGEGADRGEREDGEEGGQGEGKRGGGGTDLAAPPGKASPARGQSSSQLERERARSEFRANSEVWSSVFANRLVGRAGG